MPIKHQSLMLSSVSRRQLIDITSEVLQFVEKSQVKEGICLVSAAHATAAILVNENEHGLIGDMLARIETLFPAKAEYAHNAIDDNADAHLAASFIGHSKSFPIVGNRLVRGQWQNIFLVELDGPRRHREVHIQAVGEV